MAIKNTFQRGITAEEFYGTNQIENTGVPLVGFKGVSKEPLNAGVGVPIPGQGPISRKVVVPKCKFNNKKGEPCGARPVKGTDVCVGHSRVVE